MELSFYDWVIIVSYLLVSLGIGLSFRKRAGRSLVDYFLSGRNLPWYVAGISMVATTFAADTPLAVTEMVAVNGISGNWLWWNMLIGGMLTTFFFAKLWRKANVLTELELIEKRYSGKAAAFLRGFKAIYLGLFMNTLIIAWVNLALASILKVFFNIDDQYLIWYVAGAMVITMIYAGLSGLWGVVVTDTIQFAIAMTGTIILAVLVINSEQIGGMAGLKAKLPEGSLNFFPRIGSNTENIGSTLTITFGAFFAFISVQWWASWYPGNEPGGGGYIAQRMMSTKNEKHSVFATLFFQIAHYALRPWPWILVGLASLVLYPELSADDKKLGYVMAMKDFLPVGLKGLLLVAFLAAYMSTISTQLNWGASFLVNDFFKRFIIKDVEADKKKFIGWSRFVTVLIMLIGLAVTTQVETIKGVWLFIIECGAGLGMVLILRWYWWRINAWSEIVASIAPFVAYALLKFYLEDYLPASFIENRGSFFVTVGFTTICWILATYFTKPEKNAVLTSFYQEIEPDGAWKPFCTKKKKNNLLPLFVSWISAVIMVYAVLFLIGYFLLAEYVQAIIWLGISVVGLVVLLFSMNKTNLFKEKR